MDINLETMEFKTPSKQHVQVPNNMTGKLESTDILVYAYLKTFMNKDTLEAFPSLLTLSEKSDLSVNTLRKSIANLEANKDISIHKKGRQNIYKFNPNSKNFEMFTFDFLLNQDLSPKEKAYLIVTQQHMYKEGQFGLITYSDSELGSKIGMTARAVMTRNKELRNKNILTIKRSKLKDEDSGLFKEIKQFNLEIIGQAILFLGRKVNEHDNILEDHAIKIKEQDNEIQRLKEMIKNLQQK